MIGTSFDLPIVDGDCANRLLIATLMHYFEMPSELINDKKRYAILKSNIDGYSYMVRKLNSKEPCEYHIKHDVFWEHDTNIVGKSSYSVLIKTKVKERDEYEHDYYVDFDQELTFSVECRNDGKGHYWYHVSFVNVKRV